MKYLIIYGTTEGQTRKIARFMEKCLVEKGHTVMLADASDTPPSPDGFDAVIIGASIHIQKFQPSVVKYIRENNDQLNSKPTAFFSVCLAIASDLEEEHKEVENITAQLLEQAGWKPLMTIQVAGALKYLEYDFFKRMIMKMISKREGRPTDTSRDYEYTNWDEVKSFVFTFDNKVAAKFNLQEL